MAAHVSRAIVSSPNPDLLSKSLIPRPSALNAHVMIRACIALDGPRMHKFSTVSTGVVAGCGLVMLGGCTRTSDGSVEFVRPTFSPFLQRGLPIASDEATHAFAGEFPPASVATGAACTSGDSMPPSIPEPPPPPSLPPVRKASAWDVPDIPAFRPSIAR